MHKLILCSWIAAAFWAGVDIDAFPHLKKWEEMIAKRECVEKGRHVPDPHRMKELAADKEEMQKHAEDAMKWIQQGMQADVKE